MLKMKKKCYQTVNYFMKTCLVSIKVLTLRSV